MEQVDSKTGITVYPERQQPYTLWYRGQVLGFYETEALALNRLARIADKKGIKHDKLTTGRTRSLVKPTRGAEG